MATCRAGVNCPFNNPWFSLENRQLDGAVHPGASQNALGRIQHRVSGEQKPAWIEVRSRQTEASRIRKQLARFKVEGAIHVLRKKWSLTIGGLIKDSINQILLFDGYPISNPQHFPDYRMVFGNEDSLFSSQSIRFVDGADGLY
jgi:hypothetical protein